VFSFTTAKDSLRKNTHFFQNINVIIFDNYFAVCATDLSCLVSLPTEDGGLYHIECHFQIIADFFGN
jgi:hypothetical protein